jgi:hypothetical protein
MSAYKTIQLERTGDGEVDFTSAVMRWRTDGFPANAQICVDGLPANGTFDVLLLPPKAENYREHIIGATVDDLVMLSGRFAPIFQALRVSVAGTGGATVKVTLTIWERI